MPRRERKPQRGDREGKAPPTADEVFVKALGHPVRRQALSIFSQRVASPTEIATATGVPVSNVAYHVRVLAELGLIEVVEEEAVRGAVAHFYKAVERPLVDDPTWKDLDPNVRGAVSGHLIESLLSDATNSLRGALFEKRDDRNVSRTSLLLDEQGWREIVEIHAGAQGDILKVQEAAANRMSDPEREGIHATSAMLFFEVPPTSQSL